MALRPRLEIENLKMCAHGGPDHAELKASGLAADRVPDFSVCCNPYPLPAFIRKSLTKAAISRYPDSTSSELLQRLSVKLGISVGNILAGSGTTELIRLVALAYFKPGDKVLVLKPTYGEYEVACHIAGAQLIEHWGLANKNFYHEPGDIVALIRKHVPLAVFICNPNNPTGQYFSRQEMKTILSGANDTLFILDEAYVSFVEPAWNSLDLVRLPNVIILRSMTKDYGLAGLRLGYAAACEDIIRVLRRVCPPWNVNAAAQMAGIAVLETPEYLEQSLRKLRKSQRYVVKELDKLGLTVLPTSANFFLVKVGNGKAFRQTLLRKGILVRDCASFGLPEYIRLAPRTMTECRALIGAVKEIKE